MHLFLKGLQPDLHAKLLENEMADFKAACTLAIKHQRLSKVAKAYDEDTTPVMKTTATSNDVARVSRKNDDDTVQKCTSAFQKAIYQTVKFMQGTSLRR